MEAKIQELVNGCYFVTEPSGRRAKVSDCNSSACVSSGAYVKPSS
jgi:NADH:ubiquinone oxidoreductase subunit E